jgi:5-methyltetrahydrofolate--homocysteine methyltransferase
MELEDLKQRLIEGDAKAVAMLTQQALDEGNSAQSILTNTLIPGMNVVGELFEKNEYFVPELLLAARGMSAAVEILRPQLAASDFKPTGKALIGTVQGDLHDIGKKLVIIMLEGNGYEVVDLGVDIPPEKFVEAVNESGCRLVGLSALLTTTMPAMEKTVKALKDSDRDLKIIIGGAPITQAFADSIGADGYGRDATAAVTLARQLLGDA